MINASFPILKSHVGKLLEVQSYISTFAGIGLEKGNIVLFIRFEERAYEIPELPHSFNAWFLFGDKETGRSYKNTDQFFEELKVLNL